MDIKLKYRIESGCDHIAVKLGNSILASTDIIRLPGSASIEIEASKILDMSHMNTCKVHLTMPAGGKEKTLDFYVSFEPQGLEAFPYLATIYDALVQLVGERAPEEKPIGLLSVEQIDSMKDDVLNIIDRQSGYSGGQRAIAKTVLEILVAIATRAALIEEKLKGNEDVHVA